MGQKRLRTTGLDFCNISHAVLKSWANVIRLKFLCFNEQEYENSAVEFCSYCDTAIKNFTTRLRCLIPL